MRKGYVNWKLVLVLLIGLAAIGATVVGIRKFNRTQRAERGLKEGLAAYEEGRWLQAASGLGQYLSIHPSDIDVLLKYGHAQSRIQPFRRGNYAQAVNAYREILRIDQTHQEAAESLIDLYLQAQVPEEAELIATRFLDKQYDSGIARRLATAQIMQRKFEQAAELLKEVVNRDPADVAAYELLAHIAAQQPDVLDKTPREWIDAAVQHNPDKAQAYILRSHFLAQAGQREEAIEALQQAAECDLSDVQTRLSLAAGWLRLNAIKQAEEVLDTVYAEDPTLPELWQLRAVAVARSRDPEKAAQIAREGLEHLGDNRTVFLPYAVELFLSAGQLEAAQNAMDKMLEAELNPGLLCYLKGVLAEQKGNWAEAMAQWREALVQNYTAESVYLKLAEGYLRLEDRTSAIEILRRYIHQNPRSFSAQLMLARIFADIRQWAQASEYAAAAVRLNPESRQAQSLHTRCRIEQLAGQPQMQQRVDELIKELLALDDSLETRLMVFRIALNRQDWQTARKTLDEMNERFGQTLQARIAEAEYALRRQQPEDAAAILDQAIIQFPQQAEPVIMRAALLTDADQILNALVLLQEAESRMEGPEQRKIQLWMANLYRRAGQTEDAVTLFKKLAEQNPQDILARRQLLALSREDADIEQLQKWVDQIKQIEGPAGRIWKIEQVSIWLNQGEFERYYPQIIALMNENLAANPDDKESVMLLAAAHEKAGNLRLAVSLYRDMLHRHPEDIDLAIAAVGAMYRAEEYQQAEQLLSELLAAGHDDPRLAQLELQSYLRQGRLDTAESLLEKMVAANARDNSAKLSLALLKTRNGQYDQARVLIDELIAENPASAVAQAALTDWYIRQGRQEEALAVCNDFLKHYENMDAYRLRARVLIALGERDRALEDIQELVQRAGQSAAAWLSISELYGLAGQTEQALDAARKALSFEPDSFEAQKRLAMLLLNNLQTQQEGMDLLAKALEQQPGDVQLRLRKAAALLDQGGGSTAQAVRILNALVEQFPRLEEAWAMLTEWYLRSNQPGMAMDTLLRGLAALPESRALLVAKARIEAVRSPAVALETLNQLARKFPGDPGITEMRAQLLARLGQSEQAAALVEGWLNEYAAENADTIRMQLTLMDLLHQSGAIEQAEQLYRQLAVQKNTSAAALIRWVRLISKTADAEQITAVFRQWYDENSQGGPVALSILQTLLAVRTEEATQAAEQILSMVQSREPDSPDAAYAMAMLRHMTGNKLKAVPLYERALQLQPDNVVAMNNLAWILSQDMAAHDKALELANKGLAIAPDYADLLDTRGTILYSLGRYEDAARDFQRANELYLDTQPQKTVSIFNLAKCYQQLGKNDQAITEFYRARDLDERIGGLDAAQKAALADFLAER
jgi:tetratricopeptide (TPR) repeat protein